MNESEAETRAGWLRTELSRHNRLYYVEARPEITDREYDRLYDELKSLERRFPAVVTPDSPTQRVGGQPLKEFRSVRHALPMLSLEKVEASEVPSKDDEPDYHRRIRLQDENTLEQLRKFDETVRQTLHRQSVRYVLEPKVDGVSISVHYCDGLLVLGTTRGDGHVGDDITANIRTIRTIPLRLNSAHPPAYLEVRGEAYMSTAEFGELNAELALAGEKEFPNARNATAGTLKQLDPACVANRPISAVFYAVGVMEGIRFDTHADTLRGLQELGLPTQSLWWECEGIGEVIDCYRKDIVCGYDETRDLRSRLPYEIDGVVLKLDQRADWEKLPPKRATPGYARVHKPIPWIAGEETVVQDITIQVGRTGVLTPVAELKPVFVQGSTIARATLHNADEIRLKDIRIGDTVLVRKAGMVIPEVVEVCRDKRKPGAEPFDFVAHLQNKCPACGSVIIKQKISAGKKEEVAWRCDNIAGCPAQRARRIALFAQRSALDITGVGGVVAEKLAETGLVQDPVDLFEVGVGPLASLNLGTQVNPRLFGEKNAAKVREALDRARALPLARWLHALGIPDVGEKIAYELARLHRDFADLAGSDLLKAIRTLNEVRESLHALRKRSSGRLQSPEAELELSRRRADEAEAAVRAALQRRVCDNPALKRQAEAERVELEADIASLADQAARAPDAKQKTQLRSRIKSREKRLMTAGLSDEISQGVARNILDFFSSPPGRSLLARLARSGINPAGEAGTQDVSSGGDDVAGRSFVLTGTLDSMSRDEATALIRKKGGEVVGSVSKRTDYVVVGRDPGGNKLRDAEKLGVAQIDEGRFVEMVGATRPERPPQPPVQATLF